MRFTSISHGRYELRENLDVAQVSYRRVPPRAAHGPPPSHFLQPVRPFPSRSLASPHDYASDFFDHTLQRNLRVLPPLRPRSTVITNPPGSLPLLKKPELFVKLGTWEQAVKREWTLATKLAKVGEGQEKAAVGGGAGMAGGSQDVARPSSVTSFTDNESPHPSLASSTSSLPLDKPAFVSSATSLPPYLPSTTLPAYPRAPVTAPSTQPPFDEDPDPFAVLSRRKKGEPTVLASARRLLHRLESRGRHIVAQRYA